MGQGKLERQTHDGWSVCSAWDIKLSLIMTFITGESRNLDKKYTLDVLSQKSKRFKQNKNDGDERSVLHPYQYS